MLLLQSNIYIIDAPTSVLLKIFVFWKGSAKNGEVEATKVGALSKSQLQAFLDSNI